MKMFRDEKRKVSGNRRQCEMDQVIPGPPHQKRHGARHERPAENPPRNCEAQVFRRSAHTRRTSPGNSREDHCKDDGSRAVIQEAF